MTPTERTIANCCLIFSISTATILLIASALIFIR